MTCDLTSIWKRATLKTSGEITSGDVWYTLLSVSQFLYGVCIAEVNPSELEAGSVKALPRSLAEAVAALEADSVLRKGLGEPLVKAVLAVRKVSVRALDC